MGSYFDHVLDAASRIPILRFLTTDQSQRASRDEGTESMCSRSRGLERLLIEFENELWRIGSLVDSLPTQVCNQITRVWEHIPQIP